MKNMVRKISLAQFLYKILGMKRYLLYMLLCFFSLCASAQETAEQVLNRFFEKVEKSTLVTDFAVTITDDQSQPMNYNGSIRMRDTRFTLAMFSTEAVYDGKTLYLYSEDSNELTLSTPTQEELLDVNPVLFAQALKLRSSLRFSANAPEGMYSIDFIPNYQDAGIRKFVLRLNKNTLLPAEIQVRESRQTTILRFKNAKYEAGVPSFVMSKPDAFLNDMR